MTTKTKEGMKADNRTNRDKNKEKKRKKHKEYMTPSHRLKSGVSKDKIEVIENG